MADNQDLIPVFVLALSAILLNAEDKKGEPLTRDEVLSIRDNASCIMMRPTHADKMAESRGYLDIDPENCWYDWQMLRREFDRKPDLDPGAKVDMVDHSNPEYQATIQTAIATLDDFRALIPKYDPSSLLVKTKLIDGDSRAFVWLFNVQPTENGFLAELFEIPDSLPNYVVGQTMEIHADAVLDWMINDNGTLYGGFSLRYQRERLAPHARSEFDRHIGITKYA